MYDYFDDNDIEARLDAVPLSTVKDVVENWDMVMVAPQMAHALGEIKALTDKPVVAIPPEIYQNGSGKDAAILALNTLKG